MSETKRTFTCIVCPNGCEIEAVLRDGAPVSLQGNKCPKGMDYVTQELVDPQRTIATSVPVHGGVMPLCSVRTASPIPKVCIFEVMEAINKVQLQAPVHIGQVVLPNVLDLDCDIIATREVPAK